jgi:hypothetical protein
VQPCEEGAHLVEEAFTHCLEAHSFVVAYSRAIEGAIMSEGACV